MRLRSVLVAMFAALSLGVAACGDSEDDAAAGGDAATTAEETSGADASKCGLGNGKKATGDPIKLAGLATKQPGVDFTQITAMAKAYFDCVNDNGGVDGRPIDYITKTEQTNPQQVASLVTKLWENDKVLGFVGNTSLLDCAVNQKFYEERDIYVILAGVPRECFTTPNVAAVNMGPHYSALGAAQALDARLATQALMDSEATGVHAEVGQRGVPRHQAVQDGHP